MSNTMETAIPSDDIIHESKITLMQWGILALAFLAYVIDGFDILIIAYTAPAIIEDWGISSQDMGLVFSAGLLGMTLGAMFLGSLADLYGRRIVVSVALILAGLATSGVIYAGTVNELILLRLIAGLALGTLVAAMPPLVGEFSPRSHRTLILSILFAGASLGSVLGGLIAAVVIADHGWQSIFLYAGILTIILGVLIYLVVAETMSFIIKRKPDGAFERVNRTLKYIGQEQITQLPPVSTSERQESATVVSLLTPARRTTTMLVWAGFFLGFAAVYFLTSWVPQIMVNAGVSQEQAIRSAVVIATGGMLGTSMWGWLGRWWQLSNLVALGFLLGAILIVIFSGLLHALNPVPLQAAWPILFLIGLTLMGAFANLYTVALTVYPAQVRSTGLGWSSGLGRAGAVLSPALAGMMMAANVSLSAMFLYFCLPVFAAALCVRLVRMKELS